MDLASILAQFGGIASNGPSPMPSVGAMAPPSDLPTVGSPVAPPTAPAPTRAPAAPQRQQGMSTRQQIMAIAPILASAILNRKNPQATAALTQGILHGQMAARQQAMQHEEKEYDRRMTTAKLVQDFASGAQQIDDPDAFNQYLEYAEGIIASVDPSFQPGTLRQSLPFPASKVTKKRQAEAAAKVAELKKLYGENFDQVAETASVTFQGKPTKVRDLLALAEMNLTTDKGPVSMTPPASFSQSSDQETALRLEFEAFAEKNGRPPNAQERAAIFHTLKAKPAAESVSPIYREYQDAKREGYTGTFQQYQNEDANRKRPVINTGQRPLTQTAEANIVAKLSKDWATASQGEREVSRQFQIMQAGLSRFDADPNGGSQAIITTFNKILDPTSVVRETEYARSAHGVSLLQRMEGYRERLAKGGAGIPKAQLAEMVNTAAEFLKRTQNSNVGVRRRLALTADRYNIPHELVFSDNPDDAATDAAPTTTKKIGRFEVQIGK
jgi:hypothetical protein